MKISVIVPVYKAEKYLSRCADSILDQTFTDFELLLIDDGSPDGSGAICDGYAETDSRVRVFHKENGGVSSARQMGLDNARGEYIVFVDSDDIVAKDYLSTLMQIDELSLDLLIGGYSSNHVTGDNIEEKQSVAFKEDTIFGNENCIEFLFSQFDPTFNKMFFLPYGKIFRNDIIQKYNIRFPNDISLGEDRIFFLQYLYHIKSLKSIADSGYKVIIWSQDIKVHLFNKKRPPEEYLHCFKENYNNIMALSGKYKFQCIREYADSYFFRVIIEYIFLPNGNLDGPEFASFNHFVIREILPFIQENKMSAWSIRAGKSNKLLGLALMYLPMRLFYALCRCYVRMR